MHGARWVLVPVVLIANYFFMVVRHEGCHALVAWMSGAPILEFHIWPPDGYNLSWIVTGAAVRSAAVVGLQAALPHIVSLLMVFASLIYLARPAPWTAVDSNTALAGLCFPLLDLSLTVGGYWYGTNDLSYVFGPGSTFLKVVVSAWVAALLLLAAWVLSRRWAPAHGDSRE